MNNGQHLAWTWHWEDIQSLLVIVIILIIINPDTSSALNSPDPRGNFDLLSAAVPQSRAVARRTPRNAQMIHNARGACFPKGERLSIPGFSRILTVFSRVKGLWWGTVLMRVVYRETVLTCLFPSDFLLSPSWLLIGYLPLQAACHLCPMSPGPRGPRPPWDWLWRMQYAQSRQRAQCMSGLSKGNCVPQTNTAVLNQGV